MPVKKLSQIKAGVVGIGFIGIAHIEALRRIGVEVVGVVGSSPERAQTRAAELDLPPVYDSVEALAADPRIDVIHIASPNAAHYEQVVACLDAGKHVICEKPLAVSSEQSADLVRRAEDAGVVHAVCFNLRFYAHALQARSMVNSGALGDVKFLTGHYFQDWLLRPTDWNWRLIPEDAGELRSVGDIGSHWLDLARFISGTRVTEVMAELHTFVPVRHRPVGPVETFAAADEDADLVDVVMDSDDAASLMLRFEGGARGLVAISQVSAGRKNSVEFEVDGSEASASWDSEHPEVMLIGRRNRPNELLHRDPSLLDEAVAPHVGYPGGHVEGYPDTFRAFFAAVYADVASGVPGADPDYPTFVDGHDVLLVTDAIARSHKEQRWIKVEREDMT